MALKDLLDNFKICAKFNLSHWIHKQFIPRGVPWFWILLSQWYNLLDFDVPVGASHSQSHCFCSFCTEKLKTIYINHCKKQKVRYKKNNYFIILLHQLTSSSLGMMSRTHSRAVPRLAPMVRTLQKYRLRLHNIHMYPYYCMQSNGSNVGCNLFNENWEKQIWEKLHLQSVLLIN